MSSRYVTNVLLALFGGFVVVASRSFRPSVVGWIAFAFGIAVVLVSLLGGLDRSRGLVQRVMDAAMVALGGLAIGFGDAASGSAERWTVFAFALGWVALGLVGLTVHEVTQWRAERGLGQLHWFPVMEPAPAAQPRGPAAQERPQVA
ncbi:MAG: hypothetical protein ACRD6W_18930 [Nitrososphaerales archaeon]